MFRLFQRFLREESGQDFAEYVLVLGAMGMRPCVNTCRQMFERQHQR